MRRGHLRGEMVGVAVGEVGRSAGWDEAGDRHPPQTSQIILILRKLCPPQTPDRPQRAFTRNHGLELYLNKETMT